MSFELPFAEACGEWTGAPEDEEEEIDGADDAGDADGATESPLRGGASDMPLVYRANGPRARIDQGLGMGM